MTFLQALVIVLKIIGGIGVFLLLASAIIRFQMWVEMTIEDRPILGCSVISGIAILLLTYIVWLLGDL